MSELLWVAVPGGTLESTALVRVLVVPKLTGGSLADDGMQTWPPPALVGATIEVDLAPDGATPDTSTQRTLPVTPDIDAQAGLWERWFTDMSLGRAGVRPAVEDESLDIVPSSQHADAIRQTFDAAAQASIGPATGPTLEASFDSVVRAQLAAHWSGPDPPARLPGAPPAADFAPPDFHKTISLLREHPAVLRALGLVIELRIPESNVPFRPGFVRVRWPGAPVELPSIVSPWTRYGTEFLPGSTESISAGMVTLSDDRRQERETRWQVETVDVDLAVGRLRDAARALVPTAEAAAPSSGARPATLPALRSVGPQLVRRGRKSDFAARLRSSAENSREDLSEVVLTADDLLLGYRIDVRRLGGEWLSLQQRTVTYRLHERGATGAPSDAFVVIGAPGALEEGHIKAFAATRDGAGRLSADEIVARWSGWSLAVPRPNLTPQDPAPPHGRFRWHFEVKEGSLPRLRFGVRYAMRARVADMAGGGLPLGDAAAEGCTTDDVLYARYEPIASPDVTLPGGVVAAPLGPAEAVDHVVLRSDPGSGLDAADFAARYPRYTPATGRLLYPPRTTLAIAEQHGMLDLDGNDQDAIALKTWEWVKRTFPSNAAVPPRLPDPAAGGVAVVARPGPGAPSARPIFGTWTTPWPDLEPMGVELTEASAGGPVIAWEGDRLVVRLAPAEQVTLDVSSLPRSGILAAFAVAGAGMPAASINAASMGRHPMVTPARALTLVHAVLRPLRPPEPALQATRQAGQTFATLHPRTALFGVDAKSTGQVEVTATWTDHVWNRTSVVTDAPVKTIVVDRGDVELREPVRHEFGDTRHRLVSYTVRAVSRFRQYFDDEDGAGSVAATAAPAPVSIPSSARPSPPIVLSIVPAFRWEEEASFDLPTSVVTRRRFGGRVRMELQPPWNQTGEGELLGVIVRTFPEEFDEPDLWRSVSLVGADPIRATRGAPNRMTPGMFATPAPGGREVLLEDIGKRVQVIPYAVELVDGRWCCDVTFNSRSYCPLLQLAVARYQPNSLEGLWLSPILKTEMVPLLPDRTLTLRRAGDQLTVVLHGPGSPSPPRPTRVDVILEQCRLPPGVRADTVDLTAFEPPTDGTPAWLAVPGQTHQATLGPNNHPGADPDTWTATIRVPPDPAPLRVRVREVEAIGVTLADPVPTPQTGTPRELDERVVFADIVAVAPAGVPDEI